MHVKSTILVALAIASLALARGIASTVEEEDDDNAGTMESDVESAPDPVIALTPRECALAASSQADRTLGSTDQTTRLPIGRAILERMDENKRMNMGRRLNLDRIRNGIMARASSYPNNNIWQILDSIDWMRPREDREGIGSLISSLIDPLIMPPQMQYVDNTLRLMAIKNSMDDVLAKIFPNLHMIQHPTEQNNNK